MTSRSLLIKAPSCPFSLDVLRPNRRLAQLATCLKASGHETTIVDYGSVDTMERLYPAHLMSDTESLVNELDQENSTDSFQSLVQLWETTGHPDSLREHHNAVWQEYAREISESSDLDFVAFCVDSKEEYAIAEQFISTLRKFRPKLLILGMGTHFTHHPEELSKSAEVYDCVYWGLDASPFVQLINILHLPDTWKQLPFLAFNDEVRFCMTHHESCAPETPLPDYSAMTYPALHEARKLLFFEIEDCPKNCIPSSECTIEEIQMLQTEFNAQAFHFSGSDGHSLHAETLARALLDRHINIRYTRECQIQTTPNSTITLLPASGCFGIDFQIDSGSQRLLDRYYRHPITVTQIEKTVRACKFSNLFTVMNLAYPSIEDDHHTLMETLRLCDRCKPHAAALRIPPQTHKPLSDLKSRFETKPLFRSNEELHHEHTTMLDALQERGIPSYITPPLALMAHLAGYRGLEEEFMHKLMHQLMTGDSSGLSNLIRLINRNICKTPNTITFTPFIPLQNVVGN